MKTKKLILVSNMYPSHNHPNYGVFVRNFELSLNSFGIIFDGLVVIKGKPSSLFHKIRAYVVFYFELILTIFLNPRSKIYIHYFTHSALPFFFIQLFGRKIDYVVNFHGDDLVFRTSFQKLLFYVFSSVVKKARLIVVPSKFFEKKAKTKSAFKNAKILVSSSAGILQDFFEQTIQEKLGEFQIVTSSRIDEGKGHYLLPLIAKNLRDLKIDFHWTIIGDGKLKTQIEDELKEQDLIKNFTFTGMLQQTRIAKIYSQCSLFVFLTELEESLGLVALEAMAVGLPVVATNIGAIPEYVLPGFNGLLYELYNVDDVTKKIVFFQTLGKENYLGFSNNAKKTASSYSQRNVAKNLSSFLRTEWGI